MSAAPETNKQYAITTNRNEGVKGQSFILIVKILQDNKIEPWYQDKDVVDAVLGEDRPTAAHFPTIAEKEEWNGMGVIIVCQ